MSTAVSPWPLDRIPSRNLRDTSLIRKIDTCIACMPFYPVSLNLGYGDGSFVRQSPPEIIDCTRTSRGVAACLQARWRSSIPASVVYQIFERIAEVASRRSIDFPDPVRRSNLIVRLFRFIRRDQNHPDVPFVIPLSSSVLPGIFSSLRPTDSAIPADYHQYWWTVNRRRLATAASVPFPEPFSPAAVENLGVRHLPKNPGVGSCLRGRSAHALKCATGPCQNNTNFGKVVQNETDLKIIPGKSEKLAFCTSRLSQINTPSSPESPVLNLTHSYFKQLQTLLYF